MMTFTKTHSIMLVYPTNSGGYIKDEFSILVFHENPTTETNQAPVRIKVAGDSDNAANSNLIEALNSAGCPLGDARRMVDKCSRARTRELASFVASCDKDDLGFTTERAPGWDGPETAEFIF